MTSSWCVPLSELDAHSLPLAGGKAANLGELLRAGFNVPPGFVITTAAYRLAVAGLNQLDRASVGQVGIPAEVRAAVLAAYAELGGGPVAVRSSATAEDLAGAAFAGQQDSFLGVLKEADLLQAVRQCWASLWNSRAVGYRARLGIDPATVAIAVVVQRMVPADHAGVMFTADPVTGDRDLVVVDSSPGLGEAVVAGLVTPDHAVIDASGRVIRRRPGRREVEIRLRADGGTETVTRMGVDSGGPLPSQSPSTERAASVQPGEGEPGSAGGLGETQLRDADLIRLAEVGRRIAGHFGRPQDVEWALVGSELSVLQARPMTALPPPPVPLNRAQRLTGPVILELLPRRPYPLELDAWILPNIGRHVEDLISGLIGGQVSMTDVLPAADGVVGSFMPPNPHPTAKTPARVLRSLSRAGRDPRAWADDPRYAEFMARVGRLNRMVPADAGWTELLEVPVEAGRLTDLITELRVAYLPAAGVALLRLRVLLKLVGLTGLFKDLVIDAPTVTRTVNAELAELAELVRVDSALTSRFSAPDADETELLRMIEHDPNAAAFLAAFTAFLGRYGHRETTSILLPRDPCWVDAPQTVIALVRVLLSGDARGTADRSGAALSRLLTHQALRGGRARAFAERLVAKAATGIAVREDTHFELTRSMPAVQRTIGELGRRLAASGAIEEPEHVWYLTWAELSRLPDPAVAPSGSELAEHVRRRRTAQAELAGSPLIAAATLYPDRDTAGRVLVSGVGGGGGRAAGAVRLIREPSEFGRLRSGEVLVCPATNPSWTPLFARAAAVVVDHGGLASHAAIVAREYGIPAVMGCGTATSTLVDGTPVLVDGNRGVVLPADGDGRD